MTGTPTTPLDFHVFVGSAAALQPTSTLIAGARNAILVDAQFTRHDAAALVARITATGRRLTAVYVTHAHPDHYFGLETIRAAFPDAFVCAAPEVVEEIGRTGAHKLAEWRKVLKSEMPDAVPAVQSLDDGILSVEGHPVRVLHIGQGDTRHSTMLHVPSHATVVAGDLVANGTHVWLAETDVAARTQWLRNIEAIRSIEPTTVIAGHKRLSNPGDDAAAVLDATRDYITGFQAAVEQSTTPAQVIAIMRETHGDRELPNILEMSARAAFAAAIPT